MLSSCEITDIFYLCDEFTTDFEDFYLKRALREGNSKKYRNKQNHLSDSEVMTILIAFHLSAMRNLKAYYLFYIYKHMSSEFSKLVSYNRFVELQQRVILPLVLFLKLVVWANDRYQFVDSTTLDVCNIKREWQHKVFDGIAAKEKSTKGWFFGFKLHLIINEREEILSFVITRGNVDDRETLEMESFVKIYSVNCTQKEGIFLKD